MIKTINDFVAAIYSSRSARGYPRQPPCDETRITEVTQRSIATLGVEPPTRYLDFLRLTDGFSESSVHIFASAASKDVMGEVYRVEAVMAGFVEANRDIRIDIEEFHQVLVLGHTELYYFVYDLEQKTFAFLPREDLPGDYTSEFQTFDSLLAEAARRFLHLT